MGVIILYDHVHPVGAFAVKAAIDVRREGGREGGGRGERGTMSTQWESSLSRQPLM